MSKEKDRLMALSLCILLSGCCCLLHELIWIWSIGARLGTSPSVLIVTISALLLGLALGGYGGGILADQGDHPLRTYGLIQGGLGILGLGMPFYLRLAGPIMSSLHGAKLTPDHYILAVIRFLIIFALLLLPSGLIGALFPLANKALIHTEDQVCARSGLLYGLHLLGLMMAALVGNYWLFPRYGLTWPIFLASGLEILICLWLIFIESPQSSTPAPVMKKTCPKTLASDFSAKAVLVFFLTLFTFVALSLLSVVWLRVNLLVIGPSLSSFIIIFSTLIGGMAIGSLLFGRLFDQKKDPFLIFGLLAIALAGSLFSLTPLFEKLPIAAVPMVTFFSDRILVLHSTQFFGLFFFFFVPTAIAGALWPLFNKLYLTNLQKVGRSSGLVLMSSLLGAAIGLVVAGLVTIPRFGLQNTMLGATCLTALLGGLGLLVSPSLSNFKKTIVVLLLVLGSLFSLTTQPVWNKKLLTSGSYLYARIYNKLRESTHQSLAEVIKAQGEIIFYREDAYMTASVKKDINQTISLHLDGKTEITSQEDHITQKLLAHLPILLHPDPQKILLFGFGSSLTIETAAHYPIQHLKCVEISPALAEASAYLVKAQDQLLQDKRIEVIIGDSRQYLSLSQEKYDLILTQISHPWVTGFPNLLTYEFFQLCQKQLQEKGLCCLWLKICTQPPEYTQRIIKAFGQVFPSISLWEARPGLDYLLIGSTQPLSIDQTFLTEKISQAKIQPELKSAGISTAEDLFALFVMNEQGAAQFTQQATPATDQNWWIEFPLTSPLFQKYIEDHLMVFNEQRGQNFSSLLNQPEAELQTTLSLLNIFEAQKKYALSEAAFLKGQKEERVRKLQEAYSLSPQLTKIKNTYYQLLLNAGMQLNQQGLSDQAMQSFQAAVQICPEQVDGHLKLGFLYFHKGYLQAAINEFQTVLAYDPNLIQARINLGAALLRAGDPEGSIQENKLAIQQEPDNADAHFNLGLAYMKLKRFDLAIVEYQIVSKYRPESVEVHFNLGVLYQTSGALEQAMYEYQETLRLKPDHEKARSLLQNLQGMQNPGAF